MSAVVPPALAPAAAPQRPPRPRRRRVGPPWALLPGLLLALATLAPTAGLGAQTASTPSDPTRTRAGELEDQLFKARVALAEEGFAKGILREASMLARAVLQRDPEHALAARIDGLTRLSGEEFVETYEAAFARHGRDFRKALQRAFEPISKQLTELADAAQKAGQAELAEELLTRAFEIDPDNNRALGALRKLDYDVIFNYGVLPKAEKSAARKALRQLRGRFLERRDLGDELEYWADAWGLQTQHYRFVTNSPHHVVFAFAQACEDVHDAWDEWMRRHKQPLRKYGKPLTVFLFDSELDYETVLRMAGEDPPSSDAVLGYYAPDTKTGYFYYDEEFYAGDMTLLFETFYHEGAHQLFDLRFKSAWRGPARDFPLHWVEEGVCCYLETLVMTEDGSKRTGAFGGLVDDDLGIGVSAAVGGELMASAQFAHCSASDWDAYDLGYQHGALMIHWLMHADGGARSAVAFDLLMAERQNAGLRKGGLFEMIRMEPQELDAALQAYAKELQTALKWREYAGDK